MGLGFRVQGSTYPNSLVYTLALKWSPGSYFGANVMGILCEYMDPFGQ